MNKSAYVHGYTVREAERLSDQAGTLASLLHADARYPSGSRILEVGCGIGAQTRILAKNNRDAEITSVDISHDSLVQAVDTLHQEGIENVTWVQADATNLPFADESYDHIFICFVLEHLNRPKVVLSRLQRFLKPEGTIRVIEGDHGSTLFYPESEHARQVIDCLVKLQKMSGGNACIGRELYPLLVCAGYREVRVSPRMVYVDESRPSLVTGFTQSTFIPMVEGVEKEAISSGMIDPKTWRSGIADLYRTCKGGTFSYTFFSATGYKS